MSSKKLSLTTYTKHDLRDDVKLHLPEPWKLDVYTVISGDSGKEYWVQYLWTSEWRVKYPRTHIVLCDCPEGKFKAPLIILGLSEHICKHGEGLLAFLEGKEEKDAK